MYRILKLLILMIISANFSYALSSDWVVKDHSQIRILGSKSEIAIDIKIKEGWKIFGPQEADVGRPPIIQIKGDNLQDFQVFYPEAVKEEKKNIVSYVYKNELILPIKLKLINPFLDSNLKVDFEYAVCKDICILENLKFEVIVNDNITDLSSQKIIDGAYSKIKTPDNASMSFALVLVYAILGGLILNLMPCVLPVLSLKLFSIIKHSQNDIRGVRHNTIAIIFGIVFTFTMIGLSTIIFKTLGVNAGFGFHFQEPLFLITMVIILLFMGLNLMGVYEISLPQSALKLLPHNVRDDSIVGSFVTGIITTILATPCTAPYLAIAVSFAMTASYLEIILIFILIGFGLALPYVLILIFPNLLNIIPRSGKWTVKFKYLMGVLVLVTTVWLIDLLNKQLGFFAALTIFMLCLIAKFIMENNKYFLSSKRIKIISLLVVIPLIYYIPFKVSNDEMQLESDIDKLWVKFDERDIDKYVSENKVVILDITADWCLTCKLNKLFNLDKISVIKLLESGKVVGMKADITKGTPDDVYKFMKKYNSFGIPLNIVFGPKAKQGIVLPVELFSNEVVKAVNESS